eukprot:11191208-Lingulodinium_polyedra.AAC.1
MFCVPRSRTPATRRRGSYRGHRQSRSPIRRRLSNGSDTAGCSAFCDAGGSRSGPLRWPMRSSRTTRCRPESEDGRGAPE